MGLRGRRSSASVPAYVCPVYVGQGNAQSEDGGGAERRSGATSASMEEAMAAKVQALQGSR